MSETIYEEKYLVEGVGLLVPGMMFSLEGEKGKRYIFQRYVVPGKGTPYIECHGGSFNIGVQRFRKDLSRSIDPELNAINHVYDPPAPRF